MRRARRVPMLLVSTALAASGLACAAPARVSFDEDTDFSSLHTWDWHGRVAALVEGRPGDNPEMDRLLSRLIGDALAGKGYEQSHRNADFFVTYSFTLRRKVRTVNVPLAPYLLSSMDSSPSYWIEGSETKRMPYLDLRLSLAVIGASGRTVWKSALHRELEEGRTPALGDAVARALESFPSASQRPEQHWADRGN